MKRMILIIVMLPIFVFSQNRIEVTDNYAQITLKDGSIINCIFQSIKNGTVTYYSRHDGEVKTISIDLISDIKGRKDLPYEEPQKISNEIKRDMDANLQIKTNTSEVAGDYLIQAGNNYLLGVGLGIGGGVATYVGATNIDMEALVYIGAGMALTGFVCTLVGHTKLIKAGKALNKNKSLSLNPSSTGLGLALKF